MCGIAGVFYRDRNRRVEPSSLKAMGDRLAHRGPDGEGFLDAPGTGLVHRRLAIIDLNTGDQPIGNEDGSIQVMCNGEIYNYLSLRKELEGRGHRFRTQGDIEMIVHLYEEMGDRLCERLRGMFAFALWDRRQDRLLLARDRVGIKPLYYFRDGEKFVFGSELKAILAHNDIPCELDSCALEDFLTFGMVSGTRAIFKGFAKLAPAHVLTIHANDWHAAPRRYWRLVFQPDPVATAAQWQEAIEAKVEEAVRLHLLADVPVGAFLSGGVDSSAVVACAAGGANEPIQTFSIGFHEEAFSELPFARQTAKRFGTVHREEIVTPDAVRLIEDLSYFYDEPFADASAIPTFLVSQMASRHVKVVLSGDGGDEAFGGYSRYGHDLREAALRSFLPSWLRRGLLGPLGRIWPKADFLPRPLRAKTLLTNLSLPPAAAYANTLSWCRMPLRRRLLSPDLFGSLNGHQPEAALCEAFDRADPGDPLAGMITADTELILPDDFLVKVDRASMANGLEVRPPLLDHEVLELAARIPSKWKVHERQTKWIFKKAFERRLPSDVLWRPKQGFEIPIDAWLRGPLKPVFESAVLDSKSRVQTVLNSVEVDKLFRRHLSGTGHHGQILWSLLMLAAWLERFHRPNRNTSDVYYGSPPSYLHKTNPRVECQPK
ncbi:MAG: asparagine synthase (glutamine-hydrolyzing) [Planctomycetes bacterium]|nr:asparagine synthase (glutamine-hydrolyzing) [Planctomycetota bacterium]